MRKDSGAEYAVVRGLTRGLDLLKALDAWRDKGMPPGRIIATKFDAAGAVAGTRPLCPYPQRAFYNGGDAKDERSFACHAAPGAKFPRPAPAYLH